MITGLTPDAIAYAWRELARRAGFDPADAPVAMTYGDRSVSPPGGTGGRIDIYRAPSGAFGALTSAPPMSIKHVPAGVLYPGPDGPQREIPLLFTSGEPDAALLVRQNGASVVMCEIDIIAATFFMLSRCEEVASDLTDSHGRFPASGSVAFRQGFLACPVVDEYALVLRAWIQFLCPGWKPSRSTFRVQLSHDVDRLFTVRGWRAVARRFCGDIVIRQQFASAVGTLRQVAREYRNSTASIPIRAMYDLATASRERGLASAFYFIAARPAPENGDYDISSGVVRNIIDHFRRDGFEIGLHAGYHTMTNPAALAYEYDRLSAIIPVRGARQHYLRVKVPLTLRLLDSVGLEYDTSMGYADHEGFRCGTCHPFHVFDVERDVELRLVEVPLIVMDGTLRFYRNLSAAEATHAVMGLARRCRDVDGTFTLLWHNTSLAGDWSAWRPTYLAMIDELALMQDEQSR